jgi:hypothetical protein
MQPRPLNWSMVTAAAAGAGLASIVLAVRAHDYCMFVVLVPVSTLIAGLAFSVAVSRLYGDLSLAQHPTHRNFWFILSFLLGAVCAVAWAGVASGGWDRF